MSAFQTCPGVDPAFRSAGGEKTNKQTNKNMEFIQALIIPSPGPD